MSATIPSYTFTGLNALFQTFTNNFSTTNQTFGQTFIAQYTLELLHKFPSIFSQDIMYLQTYPGQQWYQLPARLRKINTVVINVGNAGSSVPTYLNGAGFNWPVKECPTMDEFNNLNMTNLVTSDIPLNYIYFDNQLGIYPKPAGGYNPITIRGQIEVAPISQADDTATTIGLVPYVTFLTVAPVAGATSATLSAAWTLPTNTYQMIFTDASPLTTQETILVTLTNGSAAVTWTEPLANAVTTSITVRTSAGGDIVIGSGTAFTASMVGYNLNIAQPTGDGMNYTIGTYYNSTTIALTQAYGGPSIAMGSAPCVIGQQSIIPPAYQLIPVYRATARYYKIVMKDAGLAQQYENDAETLTAQLEVDYGATNTDPTINDRFDIPIVNPNLAVNITGSTTYQ
jgi:hypothetical protein